jgi:hypothetical protein
LNYSINYDPPSPVPEPEENQVLFAKPIDLFELKELKIWLLMEFGYLYGIFKGSFSPLSQILKLQELYASV